MESNHSDRAESERDLSQKNGADRSGANGANTRLVTGEIIRAPSPNGDQTPSVDPKTLFGAFRRRSVLSTALGLMLGSAAAAAVWYLVPSPYTAFSELQIDSFQAVVLTPTAERSAAFATYKQTQQRLVKSPYVLNAALASKAPDGRELSTLSLVREHEYRLDWLREKLNVSSPATEFIRIELSGEQPDELALLVNAVTNAFMDEVVNAEKKRRQQRLLELEGVQRDLDEQLRTKQNILKKLAERLGTDEPKTLTLKEQYLVGYYTELRTKAVQVSFELMRAKIKRSHPKSEVKFRVPDSVLDIHVANEPQFQQMNARIIRRQSHFDQLKQIVTDKSPKLRIAENELEKARNDLELLRRKLKLTVKQRLLDEVTARFEANEGDSDASLQEQIDYLETEKKHLEEELENQKVNQKRAVILAFDLTAIRSDIDGKERLKASVDSEIGKLEIELKAPARVRVKEAAEVPHLRDTGKKIRFTVIAGLGVFGMIVAGIVWLEVRTSRIGSLNEVANKLSVPIIGSLPMVPRSTANGRGRRNRSSFWNGALTEAIDSTRTMLLRHADLESTKTVMITSAAGKEGKTTLACHLAISLARAGRKTLLLDADLRLPRAHEVFERPLTPGLCESLCGEADLEEIAQSTFTEGLSIISAGQVNQQVLKILTQPVAEEFFERLKQEYDFIIVDSSPVLPVNDALLIGQYVDTVLLVVQRDVSRFSKVAAACQKLSMLGIPLLGTIVIGLEAGSSHYQSNYRYGYANPTEPQMY